MDPADVQSYPPISNLSVLSKLLEKARCAAVGSLSQHIGLTSTTPVCLSCRSLDGDGCVEGIVGHPASHRHVRGYIILLRRLDSVEQCCIGSKPTCMADASASEPVLQQPPCHRSRAVSLKGRSSNPSLSAELQLLIENHGLLPHTYADDTQIYGFCPPSASLTLQTRIAACTDDVSTWMRSNRLQLNPAKILWSATSRRLHQLPQSPLRVGTDYILPASVV